jgi:enediyne core biosynthesis thioesterase
VNTNVYEHQHIVGFEETNLVGNVYYVNYISWQGRCREMFLRDHAPEILKALSQDLALVTVQVSCKFEKELFAFDQVAIRMRLKTMTQNKITMLFDYYRLTDQGEELVAQGEQEVACMQRQATGTVPTPIPPFLRQALQPFTEI